MIFYEKCNYERKGVGRFLLLIAIGDRGDRLLKNREQMDFFTNHIKRWLLHRVSLTSVNNPPI